MNARTSVLLGLLFFASGLGCAKKVPPPVVAEEPVAEPAPPPPPPPLYQRLGGADGVSGIVDSFVSNVVADKRVSKFFAKTTGPKLEHFKTTLAAQICNASGGGCDYTGKTMKDAHASMKIGDAQFDAIVQDLTLAMQEKQVPDDAQKELLDKLAAMHDDIVGAPRGTKP